MEQQSISLFPKTDYSSLKFLPRPARWILLGLCVLLGIYCVFVDPFYAIVFGIAAYLLALIFISPGFGLMLVILFLPVANIQYVWTVPSVDNTNIIVLIRPIHLLVIPCFLSWLYRQMAQAGPRYPKTGFELPSFFFLMLCIVSLAWVDFPQYSYWQIYRILTGLLFFILTVGMLQTPKHIRAALRFWVFMGMFTAAMAFFSKYYGQVDTTVWKSTGYPIKLILWTAATTHGAHSKADKSLINRAGGFDVHDDVSAFLNLYIMLTLGLLLSSKKNSVKLGLGICLLTMLVAQMMTYSRGGIGGLVVGTVFLLYQVPRYRKNFLQYSFYSVVALLIIFLIVYLKDLSFAWKRVTAMFGGNKGVSGISYRIQAWKDGFKLLSHSPMLGGGIGGFREIYGDIHAHNVYFSVLFDLGLVGFAIFSRQLWIIVRNIREGLHKITDPFYKTMTITFAAGLVAFGFQGIVDFETTWHFIWLYIGIGFAIIQMGIKESSKTSATQQS